MNDWIKMNITLMFNIEWMRRISFKIVNRYKNYSNKVKFLTTEYIGFQKILNLFVQEAKFQVSNK